MDNKILYLGMLGLVFVSFIVFHITKVNELNQQTIFLTSQINNLNNEVKSKLRPNQFIDQIDYVDGENAILFVGTVDYLRRAALFDMVEHTKEREMN